MYNLPDTYAERAMHATGRVAATKQALHVADLGTEVGYHEGD